MTKRIDLRFIPNVDWVKKEIEACHEGVTIEEAGDNGDSYVLRLRRLSPKHDDVELPHEWLEDLTGKHHEHRAAQIKQRVDDAVNGLNDPPSRHF
jgi:hypothetical protein